MEHAGPKQAVPESVCLWRTQLPARAVHMTFLTEKGSGSWGDDSVGKREPEIGFSDAYKTKISKQTQQQRQSRPVGLDLEPQHRGQPE